MKMRDNKGFHPDRTAGSSWRSSESSPQSCPLGLARTHGRQRPLAIGSLRAVNGAAGLRTL